MNTPAPAPPDAQSLALVHAHLDDGASGWNVGTYGAIAEFNHLDGDPPRANRGTAGGTLIGQRGAIRVGLTADTRTVSFADTDDHSGAETHTVGFCLPKALAAMGGRTAITELGPDADAIGAADRNTILFDLGVGAPHVDFCVRTGDTALLAVLRENLGRGLFDEGATALAALKQAAPHRVVLSRLARVEVYQAIGSRQAGVATPEGPHTHLLPNLLKTGRTHATSAPITEGWLSCLNLHPPTVRSVLD